MDRSELLKLWNDMWQEGNWIPSFPNSLSGLNAEQAAWSPDTLCHSIWQEVIHVIFWRQATLEQLAGGAPPTEDDIAQGEFALPDVRSEAAWQTTRDALKQTQDQIAALIPNETNDRTRITYHLIHDAYHLGRITQVKAMQGMPPPF